jgi:ADP-heptose:LPS heptosyltransferase
MRLIDRFAGIPFCWALGLYLFLFPVRRKSFPEGGVRSVLIIKFFGMGSVLLSTPALRLMKESFPDVQISYLSFSAQRELLDRIPLVDRILTIDSDSIGGFLRDGVHVLREIRRLQFDAVFDFEFFSKFSTLLSGASRAPNRIGFELPTRWRSMILTHQVPLSKDRHVIEAFCDQVRILGKPGRTPEVEAPRIDPEDTRRLHEKLPAVDGPAVCVNVNAGETFLERRWMPQAFAALIDSLRESRPDASFLFLGVRSERSYVQRVLDQIPETGRCFNAAGLLTIGELISLLSCCELLISNDSGPLHLAAALGTPCVGLYGPETPRFYGPISGSVTAIYKGISCSPCMNIYDAKSFRCPYDARCMKAIEVAEVEQAVESLPVAG